MILLRHFLKIMDKLIKRSDSWVPKGAFPDSFFVFHNTELKKHPEKRKREPQPQRQRNYHSTCPQLSSHLLILILIISLVSESTARPMYGSRGRGRGRSRVPKPKWVNPCGIDPVFMKHHAAYSLHEVTPLSDQELIQNILLSAKNALVHSDDFKEKFVRRTFSTPSWRDHHDTWKEQRYNWLPSWKDIPKHLHDPLDSGHLQKLSLDTALQRIYNYLQRFAVGLEEVVLDQALFDGEFIQEFNEAEYKLKAVLCELQMAMLERDIEFGEDISREIMNDDVRDIQDTSYRNLRDWYIYRDYMNGLEYIVHSFDYLKKNHHSPSYSYASS